MKQPLKSNKIEGECIFPVEFITRWDQSLTKLNIRTTTDAEGETIAVWKLEGRTLKYKGVKFDNCYFTVRMLQYNIDWVEMQIGLVQGSSKPKNRETTHWRTIILSPHDYSNTAILFSKLVIAAANLTRQGKVESNICDEWLNLISKTLGAQ